MHPHRATRQSGFAALLMVLVVGLATAALVLARVNHVRSSQEVAAMLKNTTTVHARAWKAADALRVALGEAEPGYVAGLLPGTAIDITLSDQASYRITAQVMSNELVNGAQELSVRVEAADAAEATQTQSSAAVRVTFQVRPNPCAVTGTCPRPTAPSTLVIRGDLDASNATIRFLGGENASIFVDGNVDLGGFTLNLSNLCATGDITVGGPTTIETVCTDKNLLVKDSASIGTARVMGAIHMQSSKTLRSAISNGAVNATRGTIAHLQSSGDVSVSEEARIAVLRSEGKLSWTSNASADSVETNGDIEAYSGDSGSTTLASRGNVTLQGTVKDLLAHGAVALVPRSYGMGIQGMLRGNGDFSYVPRQSTVEQGEVGGAITPPLLEVLVPPVNVMRVNTRPVVRLPQVAVPVMQSVLPETFKIDVNYLRGEANYVFTTEDDGKIVLHVKDVSGIAPGKYYLGVHPQDSDVLLGVMRICTQTTMQRVGSALVPVCTLPTQANAAIGFCVPAVPGQPCIAYAPAERTWTIGNTNMPIGAYWFDGNLELQQNSYVGSFLATGDIRATGFVFISAINTVSSARACSGTLLATNFCDPDNRILRTPALALGNAALVAGSYQGAAFSGGNIHLEDSQEVAGNVLAGNQVFINPGSSNEGLSVVTIHGRLLASGQSGRTTESVLAAKINFVIDGFLSTFDPSASPCMSAACQVSATASFSKPAAPQNTAQPATLANCTLAAGCTQGSVSQVRVFWAAPD
ncbi:hypothetical protein [Rhodoferax sp.]|jgi:hypothetical protein|uniref:hypothetical protein n=1 Tax=Rhodoferax sp. TaxID=50421 RepID=UPI003785308D